MVNPYNKSPRWLKHSVQHKAIEHAFQKLQTRNLLKTIEILRLKPPCHFVRSHQFQGVCLQ